MAAFRAFLAVFFIGLLIYTGAVASNHGWNLLPLFFGDILAMTWAGQFNADFSGFLVLSALWLAWRHQFSTGGLILAAFGFCGGMLFLSAYLLLVSIRVNGDMYLLLMGDGRLKDR